MKKKLCLFGVLTLLAFTVTISCGEYPKTVKPVLVAEGDRFGGGAGNFVIKTQAEWDNLMCFRSEFWDDSMVTTCLHDLAEKNIDFNTFQIIAVIDVGRPNYPWRINIVSVKEYSDDIVIHIYMDSKNAIFDMITQPYQIVKIPAIAKDVVFKYINYIPPPVWW